MSATSSTQTARKQHMCSVCAKPILPGQRYERAVKFTGGSPEVWKAHSDPCVKLNPK